MSYSRQSRCSSSSKKVQTKFCKVCKDAGKSEDIYTSHFVRETPDKSSKVVCPTLLSQNCGHCGNAGHTSGYCKQLKNTLLHQKYTKKTHCKSQENKVVIVNSFNVLYSESEDEDEIEDEIESNNITIESTGLNYVSALLQDEKLKISELKRDEKNTYKYANVCNEYSKPITIPIPIFKRSQKSALNWADAETSDEEDDYNIY